MTTEKYEEINLRFWYFSKLDAMGWLLGESLKVMSVKVLTNLDYFIEPTTNLERRATIFSAIKSVCSVNVENRFYSILKKFQFLINKFLGDVNEK